MDLLKSVYIENLDGVYSVYDTKSNPYVSTTNLREAKIDPDMADYLCRTTKEYNESQDILFKLFND